MSRQLLGPVFSLRTCRFLCSKVALGTRNFSHWLWEGGC